MFTRSHLTKESIKRCISMEEAPCVALVPCPGFSHLIPLLEFSKRLISLHPEFRVKFIIPTLGPPSTAMKATLQALPSTMSFTLLPPVNPEDLPQLDDLAAQLRLTVSHSLPFVHEVLKQLTSSSTRLVALVADAFSIDTLDFAKEFNLLSFIFSPVSALVLRIAQYMPKLHEITSCQFRELSEPIKLPGCVPIHGTDLPFPFQDRSSKPYESIIHICKRLRLADGIIINSFAHMEAGAIRVLQEQEAESPLVYPVGPIIQTGSSSHTGVSDQCLRWLDKQPPGSVLYVSFGSGGTLSQDQLNELALGLELSGHKFLWVVRAPNVSFSSIYLGGQKEDPLHYLPSGFLERTKEQGLVVPSWAPQIEVLSHGSTGVFLSHCGWNSILESIVNGIPFIAWPLFAEQRMNAVLLTEDLKVALWPKADENGIVGKEEVAKAIKCLMEEGEESKEIHKRVKELKDAAVDALKEDGSSTNALSELAVKWKNSVAC